MRIAAVEQDQCRPEKCDTLCIRVCPVERTKPETIIIDNVTKKAKIDENLCIGCGICVNKCPFSAISIVNVPDAWSKVVVHKYHSSGFSLFWLPIPKKGAVLGLIGRNGAGKTTAIKILSGEIVPNLGFNESERKKVIEFFRGKELQKYFSDLYQSRIKIAVKPQYLDHLRKDVPLSEYLKNYRQELLAEFNLNHLLTRKMKELSGGELQKASIVHTISQQADAYFFDEPASFLDVKERLSMAKAIRKLAEENKYVVVVEHDLIVLDYLADYVTIVYGEPGAYGYFSNPYSTRNGINYLLQGYLPDVNMKFRSYQILFTKRSSDEFIAKIEEYKWPNLETKYTNGFKLKITEGSVSKGTIVGIIGENGIGKTTFVKTLYEYFSKAYLKSRSLILSYKPQTLSPKFDGSVEELFKKMSAHALQDEQFLTEVYEPLQIQKLSQKQIKELSGGELQRVAIAFTLSVKADIYLLDEPSAYLDVEQRLVTAKAIRRTIENKGAIAFVIDHDLALIDYIADNLILIKGKPGLLGETTQPLSLRSALNSFLKDLNITFRRDKDTGRPRVNKEGSYLDRYQKEIGEYYYESSIEESSEESIKQGIQS